MICPYAKKMGFQKALVRGDRAVRRSMADIRLIIACHALKSIFAALFLVASAGAVDLPYSPAALPATSFPVTPAGMCLDGSEALFSSYQAAGLAPILLYNQPSASSPGHVWVAVSSGQGWQAVDSYFGPVSSDEFYHADMSFTDMDSLRAAFPRRSVL